MLSVIERKQVSAEGLSIHNIIVAIKECVEAHAKENKTHEFFYGGIRHDVKKKVNGFDCRLFNKAFDEAARFVHCV